MRRVSCFLALGTTTLRLPPLKLAVTESWSTRERQLKLRENSLMPPFVTQYLAWSAGFLGSSLFLETISSKPDSWDCERALSSSSSSTVALWLLLSCLGASRSDAAGVLSMAPAGGVPAVYVRSTLPRTN